jgi:hypothetical protein
MVTVPLRIKLEPIARADHTAGVVDEFVLDNKATTAKLVEPCAVLSDAGLHDRRQFESGATSTGISEHLD